MMLKGDEENAKLEVIEKLEAKNQKAKEKRQQFDSDRKMQNDIRMEKNHLKKIDADR